MVLLVYFIVIVMVLSGTYEAIRILRKPAVPAVVEPKTESDKESVTRVKADVVTGVIFIACALVLAVFNLTIYGYIVGIAGIFCIFFAED